MPSDLFTPFRSATDIDGKVVGDTTLFTLPASPAVDFIPMFVTFVPVSVLDLTLGPTVALGQDSAAFADLVAARVVTEDAFDVLTILPDGSDPRAVRPNNSLVCRVSVVATATTFLFRVIVYGHYEAI